MSPSCNRRDFLKTLSLGTAASCWAGCAASGSGTVKRPNILFLFTDDQRFDTLGALNCPEIHTPHMDRLVRGGVAFTHAHIMGGTSGAVCMPSRAMLLTGRTLFHLKNRGAVIPEEHALLPEIFRMAGYRTFGTGKWHNGRGAYARCFTHGGKIMFGGMSDHLKVPVYDFDPTGSYPKNKQYKGEKFSSELFTDEAIRFLEKDAGGEPFFMYVSFTAPHDPRMAPKEFTDQYPPDRVRLPKNFLQEHPFDNGEMRIRDERLAPWPRTPEIVREHLSAYYAMITHTDAQIGRILDALERSGKKDNTLIVFSGDNGLAVGCHGLLGKQNLYDHSVRVPLILCGPGIPKGAEAHGLCYLNDLFPTLCALAGRPVPDTVEGKSLIPLLQNPDASVRDSLFLAYTKIQRGVRTKDHWKLIKYNVKGVQTTQLFDLHRDPHELNNLAENTDQAARLASLTALLKGHMKRLDDFCDLDKPNWGQPDEIAKKRSVNHLGKGKKIQLVNPPSPKYDGGSRSALVDGVRATTDCQDGSWQGFEAQDFEAVIDLGEDHTLKNITAGFLRDHESWIFLPRSVEFAHARDGHAYQILKRYDIDVPATEQHVLVKDYRVEIESVKARYVRVRAKNLGRCPSWHKGTGGKAWLFADEIVVKGD